MHINRLKLSGFKSFVDPVEFLVSPGLTGVIGPNGCGKSNLLEALRWVMGASSAKALRGDGMDDVIFAGAAERPPRNHAEVTVEIDNSDRTAPAAYAAMPLIQVTRRIARGQGSAFRINGSEVRARDVQLLFADASTGANSPALVRQGQISELIAARPQNRRRILEEAAGVAGLHGRRHEALLRLRAAEANLARLEDVAREVEAHAARLRREARSASRYRQIAEDIRRLETSLVMARWREATGIWRERRLAETESTRISEEAARAAARANADLLEQEAPLARAREEAQVAAAVRARLVLDIDRAERELRSAEQERARLEREIGRIDEEEARERGIGRDAAQALEALTAELALIADEIAKTPTRLPDLEATWTAAERDRILAEEALESTTRQLATAQAERRAAEAAVTATEAVVARLDQACADTRAQRLALGEENTQDLKDAKSEREAAETAEARARQVVEDQETARAVIVQEETAARQRARTAVDALAAARAEAQGLRRLLHTTAGPTFPPVLELVLVEAGMEAALAAALGEDLAAALTDQASSFWGGGVDPRPPAWPEGVTPLSAHVQAPPALAARIALIGLVNQMVGPRLQSSLPQGARLVSREGDLWRWDGFTSTASAPRPAQIRLEQRNRLLALEDRIAELNSEADAAQAAQASVAARILEADQALALARAAPGPAARRVAAARDRLAKIESEAALRAARTSALNEALARLEAERATAVSSHDSARAVLVSLPPPADETSAALDQARNAVAFRREAAFVARRDLEQERGAIARRQARHASLTEQIAQWRTRESEAKSRIQAIQSERARVLAALNEARQAPVTEERRRRDLAEQDRLAAAREAAAAESCKTAETERATRERRLRQAEAAAAEARAEMAAARARLEGATTRRDEANAEVWRITGRGPDEPEPSAQASQKDEAEGAEHKLVRLRGELAALGPVNLRAEDDLAELAPRLAGLTEEREDLVGALARLTQAIEALEAEGRERLVAAFHEIDGHFRELFTRLFGGGQAELRLVESADPLESGLEVFACPPGKRLAVMSLMSGGEQALTAAALIFAVFLAHPSPICVLDEVDAPLDDANVERFCDLLDAMRSRSATRFLVITHNPLTMSRMDRLFGVTMQEKGVSQLVAVDLREARRLVES